MPLLVLRLDTVCRYQQRSDWSRVKDRLNHLWVRVVFAPLPSLELSRTETVRETNRRTEALTTEGEVHAEQLLRDPAAACGELIVR